MVASFLMKKMPCIACLKKPQALTNLQGVIAFDCDGHCFQAFCFLLAQEMNQQFNQLFVKSEQQ
jgi:hypothetical protein